MYDLVIFKLLLLGWDSKQVSKKFTCNVKDLGSIPGLLRSPGERNGYPLQYYCLENPMDRGAWWAIIYGITKSQT